MGQFRITALKSIESFLLGVFFGLAPVAGFFMATVLIGAIVFGTKGLGPWVLWSLIPGVLVDVLFLRRWVSSAYTMSLKAIGAVYVFYSFCAIGFFMGVPIGNILLGILAGVYCGRRVSLTGGEVINPTGYSKKAAVFSAAVMVLICCLITLWAIAGEMIGYRFETPIISFTFTLPIFLAVVVGGGAFLVLLQYWLTRTAAKVTFNLSN